MHGKIGSDTNRWTDPIAMTNTKGRSMNRFVDDFMKAKTNRVVEEQSKLRSKRILHR